MNNDELLILGTWADTVLRAGKTENLANAVLELVVRGMEFNKALVDAGLPGNSNLAALIQHHRGNAGAAAAFESLAKRSEGKFLVYRTYPHIFAQDTTLTVENEEAARKYAESMIAVATKDSEHGHTNNRAQVTIASVVAEFDSAPED